MFRHELTIRAEDLADKNADVDELDFENGVPIAHVDKIAEKPEKKPFLTPFSPENRKYKPNFQKKAQKMTCAQITDRTVKKLADHQIKTVP